MFSALYVSAPLPVLWTRILSPVTAAPRSQVDLYDTVQPHTMLRQHLDYQHWYDRTKLSLKEIHNVQYVAAMNPTAGSFTINPRLQRHFAVFATW